MANKIKSLFNPLVKWLLVSPAHGLLSKKMMLISVKGRKTGKTYTTPVEYGQKKDGCIEVVTSIDHEWWKNLRGGGEVKMCIKGKEIAGVAHVSQERAAIADALRTVYPKITSEQVEILSPGRIAVKIQEKS